MTVRVLVVDDSALMRKLLTQLLAADPEIEVVGTAPDAYVARERIKALNPDVVTLDIEMPRMDGLTFLGHLMRLRPTPVVMISTLTQQGASASLEALHIGAVDCVGKPQADASSTLAGYGAEITAKVRMAASANVAALGPRSRLSVARPRAPSPRQSAGRRFDPRRVIAIGASTGGTEAIAALLAALPADAPAIVVAQHIPEMFSRSFSERIDKLSPLRVREARQGEPVLPGHVYVAPGSHHLRVLRTGAGLQCSLDQEPPVNRHRPSVDVLFDSVANAVGPDGLGVLLTGMGSDGAEGLLAMKRAGARTLVQDQASSVVWGMPGAAVQLGAADEILALDRMAAEILDSVARPATRAGPP